MVMMMIIFMSVYDGMNILTSALRLSLPRNDIVWLYVNPLSWSNDSVAFEREHCQLF